MNVKRTVGLFLLAQVILFRAQAASLPDCPASISVSEALAGLPNARWSSRVLAGPERRLADVQFSGEAPVDGVEYRMKQDQTADEGFRRLLLPVSGSSNDEEFVSFYYKFPKDRPLWAICRYTNTSVTLIRQIDSLNECRVSRMRPSGDVRLSECD